MTHSHLAVCIEDIPDIHPKESTFHDLKRYRGINYEAQFYAELRAYHEAKYAWILTKQISFSPPEFTSILDALLGDLNDIGPPPPHEPALPRPDDVERVFDTRVFFEAPRFAAFLSKTTEPQEVRKLIEEFRRLNPPFPPFLLGFKHGDQIPHFRDAQAIISRTRVSHNMVPHRHVMPH
ncbi:hypothetical protein BOTBODRAFT_183823 [Botryobasidium botryosum FD-172 SS1]|uniref:Uncharacterized protein n=1 Tax=Botryobasidium botryosum (strain FD-172 SS1) TaxID=930990 RepID=A0A067MYL1_BOTB1|nr:hypothetical protein BOTBODRAFT_183823 [Botryobasidium botryosum FD-172 SS1]